MMRKTMIFAGTAVAIGAAAALCSMGPDPLGFKTQKDIKEMKVAIASHLHDPRATYNIIMRAYQQGLAPEATVIYHEWMNAKPGDARVEAAYAFSHFWATGNHAHRHLSQQRMDSPLVLQLQYERENVERQRLDALKKAPNTPEVLLETAIAEFNVDMYSPDEQGPARLRQERDWVKRVIALSPEWSDAYYYLGDFLRSEPREMGNDQYAVARESLAALQKAEQLDPSWHVDCLIAAVFDYRMLNQDAKALSLLDEWLKANPKRAQEPELIQWRARMAEDVARAQK